MAGWELLGGPGLCPLVYIYFAVWKCGVCFIKGLYWLHYSLTYLHLSYCTSLSLGNLCLHRLCLNLKLDSEHFRTTLKGLLQGKVTEFWVVFGVWLVDSTSCQHFNGCLWGFPTWRSLYSTRVTTYDYLINQVGLFANIFVYCHVPGYCSASGDNQWCNPLHLVGILPLLEKFADIWRGSQCQLQFAVWRSCVSRLGIRFATKNNNHMCEYILLSYYNTT